MIRYFRGWMRIRLTGACVENCLNALSNHKIAFWDIVRKDELHYEISIYANDYDKTNQLALQNFCNFDIPAQ